MKPYDRNAVVSMVVLILLAGCVSSFESTTVSAVPLAMSKPGQTAVDLDLVFAGVSAEVHKTLPAAYFTGLVFSGHCRDLSAFRGKLVLTFLETRIFVGRQVIRSIVTVDTSLHSMSLEFDDVSDFYPNLAKYTFAGHNSIEAVASLASTHITSLNLPDCEVTLTQQETGWDVRCGPLHNFVQKCRFKVQDGQINEVTD